MVRNKLRPDIFIFRLSRIPTAFFQEMKKIYFKIKRFFIADRMKIVPNLKKMKQTE